MEQKSARVIPIDINQEMRRSFLDYSMSVIVSRALPDVRDGLKPVHRRILYALYDLGVTSEKPHRKSAYLVGEVLGKYHPHGDMAVYDALVRMAQDFSTRYPLIDGHGNFGSVDGDSPAAMRYTEVRMSRLAEEMLVDIEKETVDFRPNYDESREEPVVLPARIPNLLVNGSSGIAVGMATNIPPHNLGEIVDALVLMIEEPEVEVQRLVRVVKGPDFPTGGIIMGYKGIEEAYREGKGTIRVRARATIEDLAGGKKAIIINELPYQVNKARLVEKIAELVREKKLEGISDLRDESDRTGMRVVIELRRDANPRVVLNRLYKHTQMEDTFGIIMLALVDGEPRILTLREMLQHYLAHRKEVITRRARFDLRKAEERRHIVEGLRIAISNLDLVIRIIRQSPTVEAARKALMARFELSEVQAQAILDMRLQRLTALERERLEEEYRRLLATIEELQAILADEKRVMGIVKEELLEIKSKFSDARRTQITVEEDRLEEEDLIPEGETVITITHYGYVKRLPLAAYRRQHRGGRGVAALTTRTEDFVEHLFIASTHHYLLFFTNRGRVYRLKVYEIPEGGRQARGTPLVNLLSLSNGEFISTIIAVRDFTENQFLVMVTAAGLIKKTELSQFRFTRRDGIMAIHLEEGDELIGVRLTSGEDDIVLATRGGLAIRFPEQEVRSMGRGARGVKGISLREGDQVVGIDVVREEAFLLAVTEKGFGKRTSLKEYRQQSRGGKGILTMRVNERNGPLAAIKLVYPGDEIMIISGEGIAIRLHVDEIPAQGRSTQGVTLMKVAEGDKVVAVARVISQEEKEE